VLNSSPLARLSPYLDKDMVIRVGGRIANSQAHTDVKHPPVWPNNHHLTKKVIDWTHKHQLHPGTNSTEAAVRRRIWIINGRNLIKQVVRKCVICTRQKAQTCRQMMAQLPTCRVTPNRPFAQCGVDYAGPVSLKTQLSRGCRTYKGWVALFICMATRAIHLELVTSLSTEAFMAAFVRFTSRRGTPKRMYSDQGTNFIGARNEMEAIVQDRPVQERLAEQDIEWVFNPPSAPHFGGLWEAGVKSMKTHLVKTVGQHNLTYEELSTVLTRIEACLNSRPLLPTSDDPNDLSALTPFHFLTQGAATTPPEEDLREIKPLRRWHLVQKLFQDVWTHWSAEYLSRLQQRPKWWTAYPSLRPGRLVIIKEDNRPSLHWRMGRITKTFPGEDGLVRVVELKTATGTLQRPVHKLAPLPLDTDKDDQNQD